ncbi:MAG: phage tail tape measure protein [Megamonas funiformis]|uniref:phage tail tape measure protein n=1 Tax=Megamonas funiformis TaxID=437897 RepID=UPI003995A068
MEQDNEKIIYDIEVRTKIDEAQQELRKLKQELKTNNREELLVNLKIVGTENFKSIKQNLSEVRKAIEILEKHNSTTLTLNGAGFDITLNKLRALEKELEDFQTKVNKGNLNNQIKEQQKLQSELEKTVSKFNKLKETFNTSFNANKALSEKELNSMIKQANDYSEKINTIYKQMGMNMKVVNPFNEYSGDYSKYFNQSKEKSIQELKQIKDAKVKQAKQTNAQIIKDEQEAISKNTQAHQSAWQTIVSIEKEKEAQYKKINQLLEQRKKIIDDIAISLRSNKAFNENQFNTKVNNSNKIINDLSSLGVHTSNPMHQFDNYDDYINKSNQKVLEQQKLSEARAKQELNNQLLLAKAEEDRQKSQAEQTEKNKKALDNYYKEEEQRIKQNSNSHKQAYQEWDKQEVLKEKQIEQNRKNLDSYYSDEEKRIKENSSRSKQAYQEWNKQETLKEKESEQNRKNLDKFYTDEEKRIQENSNRSKQAYTKITDAINKYNNILDSVNKKKQLGIQLSEQEYASVQQRLKNASNNVVSSGGRVSELPVLQDRTSFNQEARGNYFANIRTQLDEAINLSSTLTGRMSALRTVYESAYTAWIDSGRTNSNYKNIMTETKLAIDKTSEALQRFKEQTQITATSTDKFFSSMQRHLTWIMSSIVASVPLLLPGYGMNVMKEIESKFATVEQVMPEIEHAHMNSLDKNLSEMERMEGLKTVNKEMNTFIDIGSKFGVAVEEVISAGASIGRMYGQGENGVTNTNLLTQQAARIAVADNFPIMQATKGLESALSQFELQTNDTNQLLVNSNRIVDTWTLAAHRGAASAQDLTEGVSLAGAAAHQAGVSFEFLNALIATGVRTTGRSGNEIGNSIKSFINSMQSDKSIEALKDFGINVYKDNGDGTQSLRSMEDIILDISQMMQTTEKETSKLLLTLSGGKYQVSKMTAILKDYNELVRMSGLLNSKEVVGFTDKQIDIQLNTLNRKLESLSTNIKGLFVNIGENGVIDDLKSAVEVINNIVVGVKELNLNWSNWIKGIVAVTVALKGLPYLLNKGSEVVGRFQGLRQNYNNGTQSNNSGSFLGINISDSYNKGFLSTGGILAEKEAIQEGTKAKASNVQVTTALANSVDKASKATKTFSAITSGATAVSRVFGSVIGAFGGPIGIAITLMTVLLPLIADYTESLGEEARQQEKVIEGIDSKIEAQEQEYNRLVRASESAAKLAERYNSLNESLKQNSNDTETNNKIQGMLGETKDAIISLIGEENVAVDENGNIKIDTIKKVAEVAFKAYQDEVNQRVKMVNDAAWEAGEKVRLAKEKIKAMKEEAEGIGLLSKAYAAYAKAREWIQGGETLFLNSKAKIAKAQGDEIGYKTFTEQAQKSKETEEYWRKQSSIEESSEYKDAIKGLSDKEKALNEINLKLDAAKIESANLILDNKYDTGGADSNRGDKIAEPPQSNEDKKKSKAEKEAEKLAKQQADYDKVLERVAIVADETSRINNLKSTMSSGLIQSGALISSGNSNIDKAIADASIRYGVDENWIHALVQKESSYNVRTGEGTPYKGLTQVSDDKMIAGEDIWDIYDNINAGVRHFKKMLDLANGDYFEAYVKYNEGENGSRSNEAIRNATAFNKLHDDIINGTSSFGNKLELASTTNLSEATQWADQMVEDGKYYGANGCTAFVKAFLGQMNSSFADTMDMYVPDLYNNVKDTDKFLNKKSGFNAGDIVITDSDGVFDEPDHVVIADGHGGYYGNSTSQEKVVHGSLSDFKYIWGGINTGTNKGAYSTGFNDAQFVKNLFSAYGIDDEKMYNLRNVKDISMMLKMTDAMGMNVKYSQKNPIAGDILYTTDGKAFVVNSNLGYTGINGASGKSWKDIPNLADTFTSFEYAMGLNLENAGSKIGKLKLSDNLSTFINGIIDRAKNSSEKFFEIIEQQDKEYSQRKNDISNKKSLYGEFDFEANNDEYENEEQQYKRYQNRYKIFSDSVSNIEQKITEYFEKGVLKDKLTNSGFDNWKDLSYKQLQQVAQDYSKTIGDDDLENIVSSYKDVKDKADEANRSMKSSLLILEQFQGLKTPQQELEYELDILDKRMSLWKSNFAMFRGGSYDGLAWQTNKADHENTVKQIKLYSEYLARLNAERDKYVSSGSKYKSKVEEITKEITTIQTKLNELQKKAEETSGKLTKENKQTISNMLYDWIKGSSSLKDIWTDLWNEIAKVALDRLMGIKDSTNSVWDLVSNVLGFGKPSLNTAEKQEAGRYVDNYNRQNDTIGKAANASLSTAEVVQRNNSTEGIANFYAQGSILNNASQNMLLASQNMLQGTVQDNVNTIQDSANTAQDTANAIQFSTTANMQEMAIQQFGGNVSQFGSAVSSFGSQTMVNTAGGKGDNVGSYIGLLPSVIGLFSTGGSLEKFATGGNSVKNGGKIKGAGTGVSDSILAYLEEQGKFIAVSNGEYIMNANATQKYGAILEQMNLDKFASGGAVVPEPYIPTFKNPNIASNIIKQEAQKQNNNARMEELLGQQNLILTNIAKQDNSSGGNVTILNTRASKEEIFGELAKDPRALQRLLYGNQKRGFR